MDNFGDNLYNIYGSTEVAYASIATPRDLREAPTSAGKPPWATVVKILDPDGREVPTGRVRAGSSSATACSSRATPAGARVQGGRRRPDVLRRRRPVRRARPAVRRGPRRRDDRLGRRERLPAGGRGLSVAPRGASSRWPRSASTTTSSASGSRLSWWSASRGRARTTSRTGSRQNLARYKVPREIVFLDELPRNATGKILKRELAELD